MLKLSVGDNARSFKPEPLASRLSSMFGGKRHEEKLYGVLLFEDGNKIVRSVPQLVGRYGAATAAASPLGIQRLERRQPNRS